MKKLLEEEIYDILILYIKEREKIENYSGVIETTDKATDRLNALLKNKMREIVSSVYPEELREEAKDLARLPPKKRKLELEDKCHLNIYEMMFPLLLYHLPS
jgi:hypothetical protein